MNDLNILLKWQHDVD